jgi:hypothetical protein
MRTSCPTCRTEYDDAECTTVCPHQLLMPRPLLQRKDLGLALLGKQVRFHEGPVAGRVNSVAWDGMVTVEGFQGLFAPHLFETLGAPDG